MITYIMSTLKHKTKSALKKRFLKRSSSKIVFKAGYTSHRLSRRRPGSVSLRSKRQILSNSNIIGLLHRAGYAAQSQIGGN